MARRRLVDPQAAVDAVGRRALGVATQAEADATADELQRYRDTDEARFEAPVVSGSTADGTALIALLAALTARGVIVDATETAEDNLTTGTVDADAMTTATLAVETLTVTQANSTYDQVTTPLVVKDTSGAAMLTVQGPYTGWVVADPIVEPPFVKFGVKAAWFGAVNDWSYPNVVIDPALGKVTADELEVIGTAGVTTLNVGANLSVSGTTTLGNQITDTTTVAGPMNVASDVKVNTDKFTVTAATGNTTVAGTLGVSGATSFGADATFAAASGGAQRGLSIERATSGGNKGRNLIIQSSAADTGSTNKGGGDIYIEAGVGTGSQTGSQIFLRAPKPVGSGATDQTQTTRMAIGHAGVEIWNDTDFEIYSDGGSTKVFSVTGTTGSVTTSGAITTATSSATQQSLILASGAANPSSPTSGSLWNTGGTLRYYDGAVKDVSLAGHKHPFSDLTAVKYLVTLGPFYVANYTAATNAQVLMSLGSFDTTSGFQLMSTTNSLIKMTTGGTIVGCTINSTAARTNGQATVQVYKVSGGTGSYTSAGAVLGSSATLTDSDFRNEATGISFAAGDSIQAALLNSGNSAWAPTTADITVTLYALLSAITV